MTDASTTASPPLNTSSLQQEQPQEHSLQQQQQQQQQQLQQPPHVWATDSDSYELIGKIGQGAFASVWRALQKSDGRECAIKVLNLDHVDSNLNEIRLEVQAMRLSSHPNVLACHTAFVHATDLWLVTQLMRKGSSLHCLQGARRMLRLQQQQQQEQPNKSNDNIEKPNMEDHILYILHETLLGLQYIHDNGQIHRDIKAGNILLDGNGDVRIADFGVSGWLVNAGSQQEKAKTFVGTPCWMAPEVMEQIHGYDYKADIWSLGITALELAKGYAPYAKYPPMKVLILTIQEDPPSLDTYDEEGEEEDELSAFPPADEEYSKLFRQFVETCLQKNPSKRPKSIELLQSKYLNAMQDEKTRQARRETMKTQICDLIADVGDQPPTGNTAFQNSNVNHALLPGNSPVSIILSKEDNRPPGTTWVFADGSQVLASSTSTELASVDNVFDEFDQFGLQTGGEHYSRGGSNSGSTDPVETAAGSTPPASKPTSTDEADDLSAFMDEFELNTQGENFRRD